MNTEPTTLSCTLCQRSEMEIAVVVWQYQTRPLPICCQCMPQMIHKWGQVVEKIGRTAAGEPDHE
jgi:hypothetical protein